MLDQVAKAVKPKLKEQVAPPEWVCPGCAMKWSGDEGFQAYKSHIQRHSHAQVKGPEVERHA